MKNKLSLKKKIGLLDWLLFLCISVLLYVPIANSIVWNEEQRNREDRRNRMKTIVAAENFYHELTGEYTTDISELVFLVESTLDSLLSNPKFIGKQVINRHTITLKKENSSFKIGDLIRVKNENFILNPNNVQECFIDLNNGIWDQEKFTDSNKNSLWDAYKEIIPALIKQAKDPNYKIPLTVPS